MKQLNPNFVRFVVNVAAIIMIILGIIVLGVAMSGCNPARKIEKAEQLVRTTPPSFNKLGKEWNELNPCANDTFHKGKPDTVVTAGDTLWNYKWVTDTVTHHDTLTITKTIFKNIYIHDTAVVVDRQNEKLMNDSIAKLNREKSAANQNIVDLTAVVQSKDKERMNWIWYFIAACTVALATNGLWIYSKFKNPLNAIK